MLGFPIPYPNELIYSTVARAGIHFGIKSPKELLNEVFGNRIFTATRDLPCHLQLIADLYPETLKLNVENLINRHTLFPIYAPFVNEERRLQCLKWMAGASQIAVHVALLGVARLRVRQDQNFRYCPECLGNQLSVYGEYYWHRQWQVFGADCCLDHGQLLTTNFQLHNYNRYRFSPATPKNCPSHEQNESSYQSRAVTKQVIRLLDCPSMSSPTYYQWTCYYKWIAQSSGSNRGHQVQYEAIKQRVIEHWGQQWLSSHGLAVNDRENCWLRKIFRKHQRPFSYLEHIVVLDTFLSAGWLFEDEIKSVSTHPKEPQSSCKVSVSQEADVRKTDAYKEKWLILLGQFGIKQARTNGGGAAYIWLYRNNRDWLLDINKQHHQPTKAVSNRVDWKVRDRTIVRALCKFRDEHELDLSSPRRTIKWFLSHIDHGSTVENNLSKLPLTRLFFDKYCESVEDYQIRRINNVINSAPLEEHCWKRWKIRRMAGLCEQKLTEQVRRFLEIIVRDNG
jgi:hypothetical protein